jgi:hypothetical protein
MQKLSSVSGSTKLALTSVPPFPKSAVYRMCYRSYSIFLSSLISSPSHCSSIRALLILVSFLAPISGAKSMRIRITNTGLTDYIVHHIPFHHPPDLSYKYLFLSTAQHSQRFLPLSPGYFSKLANPSLILIFNHLISTF